MTSGYDWLANAGNIRDAILIISSCIYVTGYLAWAFYSTIRNLGTVRVLDAQYFAIGFPVFCLIVLFVTISIKLWAWADVWRAYALRLNPSVLFSLQSFVSTLATLLLLIGFSAYRKYRILAHFSLFLSFPIGLFFPIEFPGMQVFYNLFSFLCFLFTRLP